LRALRANKHAVSKLVVLLLVVASIVGTYGFYEVIKANVHTIFPSALTLSAPSTATVGTDLTVNCYLNFSFIMPLPISQYLGSYILPNQKIVLYGKLDTESEYSVLKTVLTDATGKAFTNTVSFAVAGTYQVYAKFDGSALLSPSQSSVATITVS